LLDTKAKIEILKRRCQDKSENVKFTVTIGEEFDNNNHFPKRPANTGNTAKGNTSNIANKCNTSNIANKGIHLIQLIKVYR
jgi:hypothetical protein